MGSQQNMYNSFAQQQRAIFSGNVPLCNTTIGRGDLDYHNSGTNSFQTNYRQRLSTEWSPIRANRPDPPLLVQSSEIYHRQIGQVPNYTGYIPGAIFRHGKTFGNDTKDGKRWIRGDYS